MNTDSCHTWEIFNRANKSKFIENTETKKAKMTGNSPGNENTSAKRVRRNSAGVIDEDAIEKQFKQYDEAIQKCKEKILEQNQIISDLRKEKVDMNQRLRKLEQLINNGKDVEMVEPAIPTVANVVKNAMLNTNQNNNNNNGNVTSKSTNRNSKIPPIVVDDNGKRQEIVSDLLKITNKITFSPINANKFRISVTDNLDNYGKVLEYLKAKNMNGNTYTPKELKPITLLVRNLEFNTGIDEKVIETEYKNAGFTIKKIVKWSTKAMAEKNRYFWLVQFDPNTDMSKLNEKRLICNVAVRYEKPTSKLELMQCRNCKLFQHSHTSCFRPFRCIKCPNDHEQGKCELPSSSKPHCVNCKGDHPANAPICPYYLRLLERVKGGKSETNQNVIEQVTTKPKKNEFVTVTRRKKPVFIRAQPKGNYSSANPGNKQGRRLGVRSYNPPAPRITPQPKQTHAPTKQLTDSERISRIEQSLDLLIRIAQEKGFLK